MHWIDCHRKWTRMAVKKWMSYRLRNTTQTDTWIESKRTAFSLNYETYIKNVFWNSFHSAFVCWQRTKEMIEKCIKCWATVWKECRCERPAIRLWQAIHSTETDLPNSFVKLHFYSLRFPMDWKTICNLWNYSFYVWKSNLLFFLWALISSPTKRSHNRQSWAEDAVGRVWWLTR